MSRGRLIILIFTTLAILTWVSASIFFTKPSTPISPKLQEAIEPISPDFDQVTLAEITSSVKLNTPAPFRIITASPSPASASARITASPEASQSATP